MERRPNATRDSATTARSLSPPGHAATQRGRISAVTREPKSASTRSLSPSSPSRRAGGALQRSSSGGKPRRSQQSRRALDRCYVELYDDAFARQRRHQELRDQMDQLQAEEERKRLEQHEDVLRERRRTYRLKDKRTRMEREDDFLKRRRAKAEQIESEKKQRELEELRLCTFKPCLSKQGNAAVRTESPRAAAGTASDEESPAAQIQKLIDRQRRGEDNAKALMQDEERVREELRVEMAELHNKMQRDETQRIVLSLQDSHETDMQQALITQVTGLMREGYRAQVAQRVVIEELVARSQKKVRQQVQEAFGPARLKAEGDLYARRLAVVHELEVVEAAAVALRGGAFVEQAAAAGFIFGLASKYRPAMPSLPTSSLGAMGVDDMGEPTFHGAGASHDDLVSPALVGSVSSARSCEEQSPCSVRSGNSTPPTVSSPISHASDLRASFGGSGDAEPVEPAVDNCNADNAFVDDEVEDFGVTEVTVPPADVATRVQAAAEAVSRFAPSTPEPSNGKSDEPAQKESAIVEAALGQEHVNEQGQQQTDQQQQQNGSQGNGTLKICPGSLGNAGSVPYVRIATTAKEQPCGPILSSSSTGIGACGSPHLEPKVPSVTLASPHLPVRVVAPHVPPLCALPSPPAGSDRMIRSVGAPGAGILLGQVSPRSLPMAPSSPPVVQRVCALGAPYAGTAMQQGPGVLTSPRSSFRSVVLTSPRTSFRAPAAPGSYVAGVHLQAASVAADPSQKMANRHTFPLGSSPGVVSAASLRQMPKAPMILEQERHVKP